jgi:uncharacterized transporter YbjL
MIRFISYIWLPIVAAILISAFYFIFVGGPFLTCFCGLVIAATLFWMREKHQIFYGVTEVFAGLFILGQGYPKGRGAFSSAFSDGFQTFQWAVVLISTLGAVYIMVRGFDNIKRGLSTPSPKP